MDSNNEIRFHPKTRELPDADASKGLRDILFRCYDEKMTPLQAMQECLDRGICVESKDVELEFQELAKLAQWLKEVLSRIQPEPIA